MVIILLADLVKRKITLQILLSSMKTVNNSKDCSDRFFQCLTAHLLLNAGKIRQSVQDMSWAAFKTIIRVAGGLQNNY